MTSRIAEINVAKICVVASNRSPDRCSRKNIYALSTKIIPCRSKFTGEAFVAKPRKMSSRFAYHFGGGATAHFPADSSLRLSSSCSESSALDSPATTEGGFRSLPRHILFLLTKRSIHTRHLIETR